MVNIIQLKTMNYSS